MSASGREPGTLPETGLLPGSRDQYFPLFLAALAILMGLDIIRRNTATPANRQD